MQVTFPCLTQPSQCWTLLRSHWHHLFQAQWQCLWPPLSATPGSQCSPRVPRHGRSWRPDHLCCWNGSLSDGSEELLVHASNLPHEETNTRHSYVSLAHLQQQPFSKAPLHEPPAHLTNPTCWRVRLSLQLQTATYLSLTSRKCIGKSINIKCYLFARAVHHMPCYLMFFCLMSCTFMIHVWWKH